jgi:hypothetical protein
MGNEKWPFEYQQEELKIREVLAAKPIIGFMVGVSDLKEIEAFIEPLASNEDQS